MKKISIYSLLLVFLLSTPGIAEAAAKTSFGNGRFTVGRQIAPGIYRSKSVVTASGLCYWSITTTGSNGNDIIENDNSPGGIITLNLQVGQDIDNSCGNFVKSSLTAKRGTPRTTFGNGVWLVGIDIAPGSYEVVKDVLGGRCYLAISTAGSNNSDIISNDNFTKGKPSVDLSVGEEFYNHGCGTFKRI
jgi:hypothetical protein